MVDVEVVHQEAFYWWKQKWEHILLSLPIQIQFDRQEMETTVWDEHEGKYCSENDTIPHKKGV